MKQTKITRNRLKWIIMYLLLGSQLIVSSCMLADNMIHRDELVTLESGERIHIVNTFTGNQMMEIVGHVELKKDIDTNSMYIFMENGSKVIMIEDKDKEED